MKHDFQLHGVALLTHDKSACIARTAVNIVCRFGTHSFVKHCSQTRQAGSPTNPKTFFGSWVKLAKRAIAWNTLSSSKPTKESNKMAKSICGLGPFRKAHKCQSWGFKTYWRAALVVLHDDPANMSVFPLSKRVNQAHPQFEQTRFGPSSTGRRMSSVIWHERPAGSVIEVSEIDARIDHAIPCKSKDPENLVFYLLNMFCITNSSNMRPLTCSDLISNRGNTSTEVGLCARIPSLSFENPPTEPTHDTAEQLSTCSIVFCSINTLLGGVPRLAVDRP